MENVAIVPNLWHEEGVHVSLAKEGGNHRNDRRNVEVSCLANLALVASPDIPPNVLSYLWPPESNLKRLSSREHSLVTEDIMCIADQLETFVRFGD